MRFCKQKLGEEEKSFAKIFAFRIRPITKPASQSHFPAENENKREIFSRDVPKKFKNSSNIKLRLSNYTHQLTVDGQLAILIVGILHLFVGHELKSSVRHSQHSRHESLSKREIRRLLALEWNETYAVKSADSFGSVNLRQSIDHATITLVAVEINVIVVLQAQARLHDPDWICHQERENSGLAGSEHVERGSECGGRVSALNPSLDCVVAVKRWKVV